jgi:pimeloyl-ACP methyl ester carboxylesterase
MTTSTPIANETPRRRGVGYWLKRGLLGIVVALTALLLSGAFYETLMAAGDNERYPRPSVLVDVDGYRMHLYCLGSGSPTVVFIGGAAALSYQDAPLQQAISETTRACIYDRAGYLWSEARPEARTVWQLADELYTLLVAGEIAPPYLLVGSSNGGIYARAFADAYADDVAGLVMVDARLETELGKGGTLPTWILEAMGRVGLFRLFPQMICPPNACDPAYRDAIATFRGYASHLATYDREVREGLDGSPEQIALINERLGQPGALADLPLVILHADQAHMPLAEMDPYYRDFVEQYREHYTALSTASTYSLIDSGHGLAVEHQDIVVEAIERILQH